MTDANEPNDGRPSRPSVPVLAGMALGLVAVMVAGVLVLGRASDDELVALGLTSVFFLVVGAALVVLLRRRRPLLLVLAGTYLLVAGTAGVALGLPLVRDDVVTEDVTRVATTPRAPTGQAPGGSSTARSSGSPTSGSPAPGSPTTEPAASGPVALARGDFTAAEHPGQGTATLIDTGERTVLTLTGFRTDNGPDLFVYLVPDGAAAGSVEDGTQLGKLKGNVGDQQYDVPDGLTAGPGWRVVVWCRAFSVSFTEATLG
ncbi:MAG: DM13 domain-containing protein [Angustibacter sp.]